MSPAIMRLGADHFKGGRLRLLYRSDGAALSPNVHTLHAIMASSFALLAAACSRFSASMKPLM